MAVFTFTVGRGWSKLHTVNFLSRVDCLVFLDVPSEGISGCVGDGRGVDILCTQLQPKKGAQPSDTRLEEDKAA